MRPNTSIEVADDKFVVRIEIDRAAINETIGTIIREEITRAVRQIMERNGPKWVQDRLAPIVAKVGTEHEPAMIEAATDYYRDHGRAKVERMMDETIEKATATLKRRILGRDEKDTTP